MLYEVYPPQYDGYWRALALSAWSAYSAQVPLVAVTLIRVPRRRQPRCILPHMVGGWVVPCAAVAPWAPASPLAPH